MAELRLARPDDVSLPPVRVAHRYHRCRLAGCYVCERSFQLCEICGRYLYLPDPAENEVPKPVEAPKPVAKPRKRRALVPAA